MSIPAHTLWRRIGRTLAAVALASVIVAVCRHSLPWAAVSLAASGAACIAWLRELHWLTAAQRARSDEENSR